MEERAAYESAELGERGAERLRRTRRTAQHRERAEEILRCVVEVLEDGIEHVALRLDRSGVEAARGEELEGERMSAGGCDDSRHVGRLERGPARREQFSRGIIIEAFEVEFEDASPSDVRWLKERRLRAARNEDFRIRRMFEDSSEQGVGGGARVEVVDREDTAGQVFPEDGDYLDRVVGGTRDGRLQSPAILMREEVCERTQQAMRIVVGIHSPKGLPPRGPGADRPAPRVGSSGPGRVPASAARPPVPPASARTPCDGSGHWRRGPSAPAPSRST